MAKVDITRKTRDELAAGAALLRKKGERDGLVLTCERIVAAVDKAGAKTKASK